MNAGRTRIGCNQLQKTLQSLSKNARTVHLGKKQYTFKKQRGTKSSAFVSEAFRDLNPPKELNSDVYTASMAGITQLKDQYMRQLGFFGRLMGALFGVGGYSEVQHEYRACIQRLNHCFLESAGAAVKLAKTSEEIGNLSGLTARATDEQLQSLNYWDRRAVQDMLHADQRNLRNICMLRLLRLRQ